MSVEDSVREGGCPCSECEDSSGAGARSKQEVRSVLAEREWKDRGDKIGIRGGDRWDRREALDSRRRIAARHRHMQTKRHRDRSRGSGRETGREKEQRERRAGQGGSKEEEQDRKRRGANNAIQLCKGEGEEAGKVQHTMSKQVSE